ncbi:hypothetical protein B0T24DRAFT_311211 [Lasiosphaeria ovina]|uniref:Uncharacterized protein n=1 Tax=Lasiosphaeria ovina TaxID=92902 RepID=A0AAE0K811_9PEZI|nr:hypothetical protein B0T24DRAFT_311211 [Lasiosphaeria ovina]
MATVGFPQPQPPPPTPNPGAGGGLPPDRPILPIETPDNNIPPEYRRYRGCSFVKHNLGNERSSIRDLLSDIPVLPSQPKRTADVLSSPEGRTSRSALIPHGPLRRPSGSPPPQPPGLRSRASLGFGSLHLGSRALIPILPRGQSPGPALGSPQHRSGFQRLTSIFHRRGQVEGYTPEQQAAHDDRLDIQRRHQSERRQGQLPSATPPSQELLARPPSAGSDPGDPGDPFIEHNRQMCSRYWQYFPEPEFQGRDQCPARYADLQSSQSASQSTASSQSDYMMSTTLERAVLDISKRDFSSGLTYVAVSRVTSLQGLMFDVRFALDQIQVKNDVTGALRAADYKRRIDAREVLVPGQMLA